jgi:hypothetical protein
MIQSRSAPVLQLGREQQHLPGMPRCHLCRIQRKQPVHELWARGRSDHTLARNNERRHVRVRGWAVPGHGANVRGDRDRDREDEGEFPLSAMSSCPVRHLPCLLFFKCRRMDQPQQLQSGQSGISFVVPPGQQGRAVFLHRKHSLHAQQRGSKDCKIPCHPIPQDSVQQRGGSSHGMDRPGHVCRPYGSCMHPVSCRVLQPCHQQLHVRCVPGPAGTYSLAG